MGHIASLTGYIDDVLVWSSLTVCWQDTYRYHGHSISDPGSSYRTRDEVQGVRRARDPIEHVRKLIVDHGVAQSDELKKMERSIKKEVRTTIHLPVELLFPSTTHLHLCNFSGSKAWLAGVEILTSTACVTMIVSVTLLTDRWTAL